MTREEKDKIREMSNISNVVLNGFYFKQFYIQYKSSVLHYDGNLSIKRQEVGSGVTVEHMGLRPYSHPIYGVCDYETVVITIENRMEIKLSHYTNPQIMNSIFVRPLDNTEYQGILASNLHPKNFQIKRITMTQNLKVKKTKVYNKINVETFVTPKNEEIKMLI